MSATGVGDGAPARNAIRSRVERSAQCASSTIRRTGRRRARWASTRRTAWSVAVCPVSSSARPPTARAGPRCSASGPSAASACLGAEALDEVGQRLDHRGVRHAAHVEVQAAAEQHLHVGGAGALRQRGDEARLADARVATEERDRALASAAALDDALELGQLAGATHERRGAHAPTVGRSPRCVKPSAGGRACPRAHARSLRRRWPNLWGSCR